MKRIPAWLVLYRGDMLRPLIALILSLGMHRHAPVTNLAPKPLVPDGRVIRLESFFERYQCPQPHYTSDYLDAADTYGLDYRMLPAISVRESTCGQYTRGNNYWGWNSARFGFESVPDGIDYISKQLAEQPRYKSQSVMGKLLVYNPLPAYAAEVRKLMKEIENRP